MIQYLSRACCKRTSHVCMWLSSCPSTVSLRLFFPHWHPCQKTDWPHMWGSRLSVLLCLCLDSQSSHVYVSLYSSADWPHMWGSISRLSVLSFLSLFQCCLTTRVRVQTLSPLISLFIPVLPDRMCEGLCLDSQSSPVSLCSGATLSSLL